VATNVPAPSHLDSSTRQDWTGVPCRAQSDNWKVYAVTSLERWEVFVDSANERTFVSPETWDTIAWDGEAELLFLDTYVGVEGVDGMQFIVGSAEPWSRAVRTEAEQAGTHKPAEKDRLTALTEKASGLIVQAASLNAAATPGQTANFAVRYAEIEAELATLEAALRHARGLVDLAGTAVVDATQP